jgi:hypothetical protein
MKTFCFKKILWEEEIAKLLTVFFKKECFRRVLKNKLAKYPFICTILFIVIDI